MKKICDWCSARIEVSNASVEDAYQEGKQPIPVCRKCFKKLKDNDKDSRERLIVGTIGVFTKPFTSRKR